MALLAACESTKDPAAPKAAKAEVTVAEARFLPLGGSTLAGAAILHADDGGVQLKVNFNGRGPGRYRVMIHATGNCSSPNGFSAGPPWAPPGVPLAEEGYPILKNDDSASYVVRLAGYKLTGLDGGWVVGRFTKAGGTIVARPDAERSIGCGVIGPPSRTLLDVLKHRYAGNAGSEIAERHGLSGGQEDPDHGCCRRARIAYGVARVPARRRNTRLSRTSTMSSRPRGQIAAEFGTAPVLRCDVAKGRRHRRAFVALKAEWAGLDGCYIRSFASAARRSPAISSRVDATAFETAHDISELGFAALAKGARPLMQGRAASLLTLTYPARCARCRITT
jgi:hypothetical protein